jgi:serine/threonine protein kinase
LFIASDAFDVTSQICSVDCNSCPEFDRWLQLERSGLAIDFRRIERVGSGFRCLEDYIVNLSTFEEITIIFQSDQVSYQIYHRVEDESLVVMKSIAHPGNVKSLRMENEVENLINLRHPCISAPIGFVLPIESNHEEELKIIRMYLEGCSLSEVFSNNPIWWTSTVKAKVVAGLVLGLRFIHSRGLVHGHLKPSNILLNFDYCVQIVDFDPILFENSESEDEEVTQLGGFSKERWIPEKDLEAFATILFEIVFGRPLTGEVSVPSNIPSFVSQMIESGLDMTSEKPDLFNNILKVLKQNDFQIDDEVDSSEVSAFVSWVESAEQLDK